jgi:hypothetical protein
LKRRNGDYYFTGLFKRAPEFDITHTGAATGQILGS